MPLAMQAVDLEAAQGDRGEMGAAEAAHQGALEQHGLAGDAGRQLCAAGGGFCLFLAFTMPPLPVCPAA